jgi:hypothetical protein
MRKYDEWIEANVDESFGLCAAWTKRMAEEFPELRRARGHYLDALWGPREHWWLVAPDGSVVDPTKDQLPDKIGKCLECGAYVYAPRRDFCSDAHERSYVAYIMGGPL